MLVGAQVSTLSLEMEDFECKRYVNSWSLTEMNSDGFKVLFDGFYYEDLVAVD